MSKIQTAYGLGAAAGLLMGEKPEGWKRKLRANVRKAKELGVKIDLPNFNDIHGGNGTTK